MKGIKEVRFIKKILMQIGVAIVLLLSICTVALAEFRPKVMPYNGEKWYFDIEEKEHSEIKIIPKDKDKPQVYENGYVRETEPKQGKYEIILLRN